MVGGLVGYNYGAYTTSCDGCYGGSITYTVSTINNSFWYQQSGDWSLSGIGDSPNPTSSRSTGADQLADGDRIQFRGLQLTTTPGASGNNWVIVDADGSLNNTGWAIGATFPMLASEYSTTINTVHTSCSW